MCTVVIFRQPGARWPVLIAANRDEMATRPWKPPARYWPDQPAVTGGVDVPANGTWLAMNDAGVVAGVLNRVNTLGPAPGFRSRGEIPLFALDQPTAADARDALLRIDPSLYRPFNAFVVDETEGYWLRCVREEEPARPAPRTQSFALGEGLSMITAHDCNDTASPRIRRYLPLFRQAAVPRPELGDWRDWISLLRRRDVDPGGKPGGAMTVVTENGFGTVCSSLIALPNGANKTDKPIWLFADGRPDSVEFEAVAA